MQVYHHVFIGQTEVIVAIDNNMGNGSFDYWSLKEGNKGQSRVSNIKGEFTIETYWIDCVSLEMIERVNSLLNTYNETKQKPVIEEFCADDIPF